jgi:hypothetical protein
MKLVQKKRQPRRGAGVDTGIEAGRKANLTGTDLTGTGDRPTIGR